MPAGKTAKTTTKNARTKTNRAKRGAWSQSLRQPNKMSFPFETCNGKRNRSK